MSQAKTQMPNKSFGLNTNTSVQSTDDNNWSTDGLGHFRSSNNTNTGDSSMNWSSSGAALTAANLISSNSSNSSSSDLWSNDNHNNFNQNLDELLKNDKVIINSRNLKAPV